MALHLDRARRTAARRAPALPLLLLLLVGACADGDDGTAGPTSTTVATSTTTTTVVSTTTTTVPVTVEDVAAAVTTEGIEQVLRDLVGERRTAEQRAAARAVLAGALEEAGYDVVEQPFGDGGVNLVARLDGTDPEGPVVVVGAHYDTVEGSPGADDNASGSAGLVEIGRALASTGARPEVAVELVLFDLEEIGLLGSRHYVTELVREGRAVAAAFIFDMIAFSCHTPGCQFPFPDIPDCLDAEPEGRDVGDGIAVVANERSSALLDQLVATAGEVTPDLVVGVGRFAGNGECLPDSRRSDHAPFWDAGMPALFLTDTANFRNPNYHEPTDTLETLDLGLATNVSRATAAAVATAAGVPFRA